MNNLLLQHQDQLVNVNIYYTVVVMYIGIGFLITLANILTLKIMLKNNPLGSRPSVPPSVSITNSTMDARSRDHGSGLGYFAGSDENIRIRICARKAKRSLKHSGGAWNNSKAATAFLISLSSSYLIRGAGMVPLFIIVTFFGESFSVYKRCNYYMAVTFFNNLTGYCCAYSQLGIAIDRFRAIVTPFRKGFTAKQCRIAIAFIWFLATGAALPAMLILYSRKSLLLAVTNISAHYSNKTSSKAITQPFCQFTRTEHLAIISLQTSAGCGIPVLTCCVLYAMIIAKLWSGGKLSNSKSESKSTAIPLCDRSTKSQPNGTKKHPYNSQREIKTVKEKVREDEIVEGDPADHRKQSMVSFADQQDQRRPSKFSVRALSRKGSKSSNLTNNISHHMNRQNTVLSASALRRNRNAIKMVVIILLLYALCSVPFYVMTILEIGFTNVRVSFLFEHLHNVLIMTDHWLHVGVYLYFNVSFRQALYTTLLAPLRLLCQCWSLPFISQFCARFTSAHPHNVNPGNGFSKMTRLGTSARYQYDTVGLDVESKTKMSKLSDSTIYKNVDTV